MNEKRKILQIRLSDPNLIPEKYLLLPPKKATLKLPLVSFTISYMLFPFTHRYHKYLLYSMIYLYNLSIFYYPVI